MKTKVFLLSGLLFLTALILVWRGSGRYPTALFTSGDTHIEASDFGPHSVDTTAADAKNPPPGPEPGNFAGRETMSSEFEQLLNNRRFSDAVDLYQEIYSRYDESVSNDLRSILFEKSAAWAGSEPELAAQALKSYVQVFYRDVDALLRLAGIHEHQRDYQQSLFRLQEAHAAAHTQVDLGHIQSRIDRLVGDYTLELKTHKNHNGLVSLYRKMIERQPNHAPYYLELAQAYLAVGSRPAALDALRYIEYDSEVGIQARELIAKLDSIDAQSVADGKLTAVPLIPVGKHFLVSARINNVPAKLMLDTGASITVIKSRFVRAAGISVDHSHIVVLTTANGTTHAPTTHLDQLEIGDQLVTRFKAVVLELEELTGVDGLLGMDFLGRYRFTIDRDHNKLVLNR